MRHKTHNPDASVNEAIKMMNEHPGLAEALLEQTLKHHPEHKPALEICGVIQHHLGKNKEAAEKFLALTKLDPEYADNWANLGTAYGGLGRFNDAIEVMEKSVRMEPKQPLYRNNLAIQYRAAGRYEEAIRQMKLAINLGPGPQTWDNLGSLYTETGQYEEAIKCHQRAIGLNPKFIPAQINLSLAYHFSGDWQKGFEQQEWRFFYYPSLRAYLDVYDVKKMWDGKDDLNGKRVLVFGEQGFGDIIMFGRFLKDVKARGAYVMLHVPPELNDFMRGMDGIDEIVNSDIMRRGSQPLPEYDYQFPIMSAPHLLGIKEIEGKPYAAFNDDGHFTKWLKDTAQGRFNVGIVWAGNPENPDDRDRSIPVHYFKELAKNVPEARLFSLQLGNDVEKVCDDNGFADLSSFIKDFKGTANIINALDLVICCDTAIAHVAGATGFPVWDLVRYGPDWRWPQREEKTHWYDSMRQFHQTKKGDWKEVFERVTEELKKTSREKLGS
jgi:tetratricopeptide (TPR) repeat protein